MFDIGWTELMVIGIVALIVVGPKDLPGMFRTLGRFTGKARRMAREFQRAMEDAADEAGVKEASSALKSATSPKSMGLDTLNKAADSFDKWEPGKPKTPPKAMPSSDDDAYDYPTAPEPAAEEPENTIAAEAAPEPEAEAPAAEASADAPASEASPVKKTPARKPAAKKAPAKKAPAKTTAAKKTPAKKPATRKTTKPKPDSAE